VRCVHRSVRERPDALFADPQRCDECNP